MEIRKILTGRRYYKPLDMEQIYREIDSGKSVETVAKEWGVSRSTLYRRHAQYQEMLSAQEAAAEDSGYSHEISNGWGRK